RDGIGLGIIGEDDICAVPLHGVKPERGQFSYERARHGYVKLLPVGGTGPENAHVPFPRRSFAARPILLTHPHAEGRLDLPRVGNYEDRMTASRESMRKPVRLRAHPSLNRWELADDQNLHSVASRNPAPTRWAMMSRGTDAKPVALTGIQPSSAQR